MQDPRPEQGDTTSAALPQTTLPLIGQPWPGEGGIFAGLQLNSDGTLLQALILSPLKPAEPLAWSAGLAWAAGLNADGHSDFAVPTRHESALLFATLQQHFDRDWSHWTSTQYADNAEYAWYQYFSYGNQYYVSKSVKRRVRFVRRLPLGPLILQHPAEVAAA